MNKRPFLLYLALILPLLAHGQYYNYAPNTLNIPCLSKRGDASFGVGWGRGNGFQALELQGAYSPFNHVAIMANYFGAPQKGIKACTQEGTDAYFWETGIGIYEPFATGAASLFAGYGNGALFSCYREGASDLTSSLNQQRWFIQPGFAYQNKFFQIALALRLSRIAYGKGEISYRIDPYYLEPIKVLGEDAPLFLPELGVQAGIRLRSFFVLGISISSIFPDTDNWNFARLNANISAKVDLPFTKDAPETKGK